MENTVRIAFTFDFAELPRKQVNFFHYKKFARGRIGAGEIFQQGRDGRLQLQNENKNSKIGI